MKDLYWVGRSRKDLMRMPERVKDVFGYGLYLAQMGDRHPDASKLRGLGNTWGIRMNWDGDTYRAVYCVGFGETVYFLHVFRKKSHEGRKTPRKDLDLIRARLIDARTHFQTHCD